MRPFLNFFASGFLTFSLKFVSKVSYDRFDVSLLRDVSKMFNDVSTNPGKTHCKFGLIRYCWLVFEYQT